jgi:hypothetical protein
MTPLRQRLTMNMHQATQAWLAEQQALLLPAPYFLVTFTLPSELRAIARQQPQTLYPLLFGTSAAALAQLAQNPRFLGGQIGRLGVLQTWRCDLRYTPTSAIWCRRLPWRQIASAGWSGSETFSFMSSRSVSCFGRRSARPCARRRGRARLTRAPGPSPESSTVVRLGAGRVH